MDATNQSPIVLSKKMGITLTLSLLLGLLAATAAVTYRVATFEARMAAIEARADWSAEGMGSLVTEIKSLRNDLTNTDRTMVKLNTQLETIMQWQGSSSTSAPPTSQPTRSIIFNPQPQQTVVLQPQQSEPPKNEAPEEQPPEPEQPQPPIIAQLTDVTCHQLNILCRRP